MTGLLTVTNHQPLGDGWQWVEVLVEAGDWPGYASVLVAPDGRIAIEGDGGNRSWSWTEMERDEAETENLLRWARRQIESGNSLWPVLA